MIRLRAICILIGFGMMIFFTSFWQGTSVKFKCRRRKGFPQKFHKVWCRLFGIKVIVVGKPATDGEVGALLVANHQSYMDIPIIGCTTRQVFVSRADAAKWPIVGMMVRLQESVLIERAKRGEVGKQMNAIRDRLLAGDSVVIFAEGTTSDGNRIKPFKSSLLAAAEATDTDTADILIQPVSVTYVARHGMPIGREFRQLYTWYGDDELVPHLWEMLKSGPLDVVVEYHEPFTMNGLGRKQAAEKAERIVRAGVEKAARRWRSAA